MNRRLLAVIVLSLVALVVALPASAGRWQATVIQLVDLGGTDQMIDVGNDGFGPGDSMLIDHALVIAGDNSSGPAGGGSLNAALLVLANGLASVSATITLPGGALAISGQFNFATGPTAPFSVTGKSGRFRGLSGQMTISNAGGSNQEYRITLRTTRGHGWSSSQCLSAFGDKHHRSC